MTMPDRFEAAEALLYDWACGRMTTGKVKQELEVWGFRVDFRQPDRGNAMEATDLHTGQLVTLYV